MDKYAIGIDIPGLIKQSIEDEEIDNIEYSIVAVVLDDDSSAKLYSYYSKIKSLILNNNRLILIIVGEESKIRKQLCMLMLSYEKYDIYSVNSREEIDKEYIETVISREPTEEEAMTYIGTDIVAYASISELLMELGTAIDNADLDKVKEIISNKKDIINSSIDVIDYMKKAIDNVNMGKSDIKLNELKETINSLENKLEESNKNLKDASDKNIILSNENKLLNHEAFTAKLKVTEIEEQLNNRSPIIKTYLELQTPLIKCKVKSIIYFKEITYVRYVNSFITTILEKLQKYNKLRAKLIIYDNKNSFSAVYKPVSIIGSSEYMSNRDAVVNTMDKLVVVESNQAIIEDILKSDYDVVIVYDRLKQATDIVTGNNVYKYWVINSKREYSALYQSFKIEEQHIITRPGVFEGSIDLGDIPNYKESTPSAKMMAYIKMSGRGQNKKSILDIIFERTNIVSMTSRDSIKK